MFGLLLQLSGGIVREPSYSDYDEEEERVGFMDIPWKPLLVLAIAFTIAVIMSYLDWIPTL